jgi:O-antigen ligase
MIAFLDKTLAIGLLSAVILANLAFGSVEPITLLLVELVVLALAVLWAVKMACEKRLLIAVPSLTFPLLALLVLGLVQSISVTGPAGQVRSLSMDAEATRGAVIGLFFLTLTFLMTANLFMTVERLRLATIGLVIFGALLALFALAQHFGGNGKIYGIREPHYSVSPFGPYSNHNHYAGYIGMLIPLALALLVRRTSRGESLLFYGFAAALMSLSLIVSLSRGGMISLGVALVFLAVMAGRARRPERLTAHAGMAAAPPREMMPHRHRAARSAWLKRFGLIAAFAVAIVAGVLWLAPERVVNRVLGPEEAGAPAETFYTSRGWIWQDTLTLIKAHPVTGVGLGAYETAYPIYSTSDGALRVNYAHNDYLQILSDGGIIGGIIALWFIVLVVRAISQGVRMQDPWLSAVALGSGSGIIAMLVHSLFDFNLQLPANAMLFLFLTAILSSLGAVSRQPARSRQKPEPLSPSRGGAIPIVYGN